jgi:hypothetical protein
MFNRFNSKAMKKFLLKGILAGIALLAFSYVALLLTVQVFPGLADEYYSPVFSLEGEKSVLFFLHPFIVSFALAWFWRRFKGMFEGPFWLRGIEVGLAFGIIAVLPSMWMTFSAFAVSLTMVLTWVLYGLMQGVVAGIIYAKVSP